MNTVQDAGTGGQRLLLIDNDPAILEGMVTLLEDWRYQTLAAPSADAAITLLDAHGLMPDAILADYHLDDGATGSEAIQRIILTEGTAMDIAKQAELDGVRDLRQSGLVKVRGGWTSLEEIINVTNE